MRALQVDRSLGRFAAARVASEVRPGAGGRLGTLRLVDQEPPALPGADWVRLWPRLAGICGSDLATVDGRSSRWFEPIVSFPFVPGHEVVADTEDGRRVVIEPVLGCEARGIRPPCVACAAGQRRRCRHLDAGHVQPGLQTGFCASTGGGWSGSFVAHHSQLHAVPEGLSDEAAVLVEPAACAVHGALSAPAPAGGVAAVIGAGTLGLLAVAALRSLVADAEQVIVGARYAHQRRLATALGATAVAGPGELGRAVRRATGTSMLATGQLTGGAGLVLDCVGSAASLTEALALAAPGATIVLLGMPGPTNVDLTALWQREITLVGSYTYGPEPAADGRHSFDLAFELAARSGLERLLSATYSLDRFPEAMEHAASAGRRGAVKVAFDLRGEKHRQR